MTDCRQIESLLPPYVDGEAGREASERIETHLSRCSNCRDRVAAERTARAVLRAKADCFAIPAPPGLRTRLTVMLRSQSTRGLGWRGRLTAFAAAAAVVLMLASALELVSPRANVLFAAQLAIDHLRCFIVERGSTDRVEADDVRRHYGQRYGWTVDVPGSNAEAGITLVAARRCPFWIGNHAHMLYRSGDRKVSLYITRGDDRPHDALGILGHVERIWTANGNSYAIVARDVPPADLSRIARYLETETKAE
jgi:anti-sigma factor (TIGR02949 family)